MDITTAYTKWLGIPAAEQPPDHYRILGLRQFENDPEIIANAADQRMTYLRTFQAGPHGQTCQTLLNQIAAARVCLLNGDRKSLYDAQLAASIVPPPVPVLDSASIGCAPIGAAEIVSRPILLSQSGSPPLQNGSPFNVCTSVTREPAILIPRNKRRETIWALAIASLLILIPAVYFLSKMSGGGGIRSEPGAAAERDKPKSGGVDGLVPPAVRHQGIPQGPNSGTTDQSNGHGAETKRVDPPLDSSSGPKTDPPDPPDENATPRTHSSPEPVVKALTSVLHLEVWAPGTKRHGCGFLVAPSRAFVTNERLMHHAVCAWAMPEGEPPIPLVSRVPALSEGELAITYLDSAGREPRPALTFGPSVPKKAERVFAIHTPSARSPLGVIECIVTDLLDTVAVREILRDTFGKPVVGVGGFVGSNEHWIRFRTTGKTPTIGSPLLNLSGQVVGIVSQTCEVNPDMSFALAASDIHNGLRPSPKLAPSLLRDFPYRQPLLALDEWARPLPGNPVRAELQRAVEIQLPGGEVLTEKLFQEAIRDFDGLINKPEDVFVIRYPDGVPFAAIAHDGKGQMDGPVVAVYPAGQPMLSAHYKKQALDGDVMTWDENGRRVVFSQWRSRKLNGYACLFVDERLIAVLTYKNDELQELHVVDGAQVVKSIQPAGVASIEDQEVSQLLQYGEELNVRFRQRERQFRRNFIEQWNATEKARKQALSAVLSSIRQEEILDRLKEHQEENNRFFQDLRERFHPLRRP